MRIWYDTEFWERGTQYPVMLISIGMVREDGAELYLINGQADVGSIYQQEWLRENVLKHLPMRKDSPSPLFDWDDPRVTSHEDIGVQVSNFLMVPDLELWAWYGSYDHVVMAQTFGTMMDLPRHVPMWTNDVRQEVHRQGNPRFPQIAVEGAAHDALYDAKLLKLRHEWLMDLENIRVHGLTS